MSKRRMTHGDVVRDVVRRRRARAAQAVEVEAIRLLKLAGHAPLCAMHMSSTGECRCAEARSLGWKGNSGNEHRREEER